MNFLGNFKLNISTERRSIDVATGFYPNGTLFKEVSTTDSITGVTTITFEPIATAADIDNTCVGILMVQPEGVNLVKGDQIDLTVGTIRIDITAYEAARLDEIKIKGSSKMTNMSALLVEPKQNHSITANGCVVQLVQVVR